MRMLKLAVLFGLIYLPACNTCKDLPDEEAIECLNRQPVRDLKQHFASREFLKRHKVYLTMTTSPGRLKNIGHTLRTLDLENVEKIFLSLPKLYRNQEPYGEVSQEILERFPKLEVIAQDQEDLGPVMKMLPALEKVAEIDPEALVISIDDDVGYSQGLISEFIRMAAEYPNAVFSGWGNYVELHGIIEAEWPKQGKATKEPLCGSGPISYCDTVEGWRAIGYRPRLVNTQRLRSIANISKACRTSDDITISYVIAEGGADRIKITNEYVQAPKKFSYNYDSNALHEIKLNIPGWSPRSSVDGFFGGTTNPERYQRCVLDIIEYDAKQAQKS